jgi:hypothetical protein
MWQPSPYVFTTELGEPCDPRNALRALKAAAQACNAAFDGRVAHAAPLRGLSHVVGWRAA